GLFFAIVLNDPRVKGQRLYRSLLIFPYTIPAFVSALVCAGLMNTQFGFINQVLLHSTSIDWLGNGFWAKVSLLIVNTWLGYPYMFIVTTGALQSIPDEAIEAARIDGASSWKIFTNVKLPLLMVPIAPLLISSFAFNFNNFALIWMLTGGGPRFSPYNNIGQSDILISMVYKIANNASPQYGLASAFSILIFIVVGIVAWLGFKQTKALEDIN
ncbi:MAG: ABC transporter permease subunit, partial [Propionibacteriaceae bacterium]